MRKFLIVLSPPACVHNFSVYPFFLQKFPELLNKTTQVRVMETTYIVCLSLFSQVNLMYVFQRFQTRLLEMFIFTSPNLILMVIKSVFYIKTYIVVCINFFFWGGGGVKSFRIILIHLEDILILISFSSVIEPCLLSLSRYKYL